MKKFEIPDEIEKELQKRGGWNSIKRSLPLKEIKEVEKVMKVLSCKIRLKILYALAEQRMCVCMLADLTKCSYPKCSYHISKLKEVGLIKATRKGNYLIYSLTPFGKSIVRHFNKYKPRKLDAEKTL
ncbi:MAG: ArsR family transcriptional regulator [Thermoplasmata archaeon]|nr:MAG: ArsR family transcriptional regulator [Thermoplasmata archaeon]